MTTTIFYLGIRFSAETERQLHKYRLLNHLIDYKMPKLGFHTTIIHSKTTFKYTISSYLPKNHIGTVGKVIELYGSSVVLPFQPPLLEMMYSIVKSSGATSDYDIYKPHVTIAENCTSMPTINRKWDIPIIVSEIFYKEWETQ